MKSHDAASSFRPSGPNGIQNELLLILKMQSFPTHPCHFSPCDVIMIASCDVLVMSVILNVIPLHKLRGSYADPYAQRELP